VKTTQASQVEAQFFLADELHPTPAINTITHAVRIKGPLVPDRLARAMAGICRRHDVLRSRFAPADGAITRLIDTDAPPPALALHDAPEHDAAIATACESLRQGLSPESAAWGMVLLRHGPQDHTFIFSAHRIIWDESSTRILGQDITQAYRADADPDQVELPPGTDVRTTASLEGPPADDHLSPGARHWAAALADVPLCMDSH
jgi:hypothetical protein